MTDEHPRLRSIPTHRPSEYPFMNDDLLQRYSRHLLMPEIDLLGQEKLIRSKVLIIGLGGLGSPVAMYLAASGIGTLTLCDNDVVDISNLQRQILHQTASIGQRKTDSARGAILALNPTIHVRTLPHRLEGEQLYEAVEYADLVIDGSDNFQTRHAVNAACNALRTPLISGSAIRMSGQIISFRFDLIPTPCYCCLYPDQNDEPETCERSGILAPLVGVIGSLQAIEAIKILLNFGQVMDSRLLQLDAKAMKWHISTVKSDPACPICSKQGQHAIPLEYQTASR